METRVLIWPGPNSNATFPLPQWCFRSNLITIGLVVLEIFKFENVNGRTDAHTDGWTLARPLYYKLPMSLRLRWANYRLFKLNAKIAVYKWFEFCTQKTKRFCDKHPTLFRIRCLSPKTNNLGNFLVNFRHLDECLVAFGDYATSYFQHCIHWQFFTKVFLLSEYAYKHILRAPCCILFSFKDI